MLRLIQALAATAGGRGMVLDVVQAGVQSVTGDEILRPANADVLGLCRVVTQETPHIRCRNIDLVAPADQAACAPLLEHLLQELAFEPRAREVAYRGRFRWELDYQRVDAKAGGAPRLRERGVYWITGGTGGIGLAVARHLAETCRARLILTKRNPFPEKSQWRRSGAW